MLLLHQDHLKERWVARMLFIAHIESNLITEPNLWDGILICKIVNHIIEGWET